MGEHTRGSLLFIFGKCLEFLFKLELFMMLSYYESFLIVSPCCSFLFSWKAICCLVSVVEIRMVSVIGISAVCFNF